MTKKSLDVLDESYALSQLAVDLDGLALSEIEPPPRIDRAGFRMCGEAHDGIMRLYALWASAHTDAVQKRIAVSVWDKRAGYVFDTETADAMPPPRRALLTRSIMAGSKERFLAAILLAELQATYPKLRKMALNESDIPNLFNGWKNGTWPPPDQGDVQDH